MNNQRNTSILVGTDNVVLSESKNIFQCYRSFFNFTNTSTGGQVISITSTDEAGAGSGVVIYPGGYYGESKSEGFYPTNERICAVSSLAGGTVAVSERVVQKPLPLEGQ